MESIVASTVNYNALYVYVYVARLTRRLHGIPNYSCLGNYRRKTLSDIRNYRAYVQ